MEVFQWNELDNHSHDELECSKREAVKVLVHVKWVALNGLTTIFNHSHLHEYSEDSDENEQPVAEESVEHINLSELNLSGVDLIEYLHEHKDLENVGEMNQFLSVRSLFDFTWENTMGTNILFIGLTFGTSLLSRLNLLRVGTDEFIV